MASEGNGAQYVPVWLTEEQWATVGNLVVAGIEDGVLLGLTVEDNILADVITDAIEWAENH